MKSLGGRKGAAVATAIAFVIFTVSDIFRAPSQTDLWLLSLYVMALAIGLAYRSVAFPLMLLMLAFMGPEDLFFFLFKRRLPPSQLPKLYGHVLIFIQPARPLSLYVGLAVALSLGAIAVFAETKIKEQFRRPA
jgi:hypothetical protein